MSKQKNERKEVGKKVKKKPALKLVHHVEVKQSTSLLVPVPLKSDQVGFHCDLAMELQMTKAEKYPGTSQGKSGRGLKKKEAKDVVGKTVGMSLLQ